MPEYKFKTKDEILADMIADLKTKLPPNTDFNDGPLRDILEANADELDKQYWQLKQVYENGHLDGSYEDDVDKVIAILGVKRNPAVKSLGKVTFFRSTPATQDYYIPSGTLIETLPDNHGVSVKFQTTKDATLTNGASEIQVDVECFTAGLLGNIAPNTIKIINNPPLGIESVRNDAAMTGGEDKEDDDTFKERAKHALDSAGLGTISALIFNIAEVPGAKAVSVNDMARGIGTVDVLVLADTLPMSQIVRDAINAEIQKTKAGGIDVQLVEPTIKTTNITVSLTLKPGSSLATVSPDVREAIQKYVNGLAIGESLIKNQLSKSILSSNDSVLDLNISAPAANVTATASEIIQAGTITIT